MIKTMQDLEMLIKMAQGLKPGESRRVAFALVKTVLQVEQTRISLLGTRDESALTSKIKELQLEITEMKLDSSRLTTIGYCTGFEIAGVIEKQSGMQGFRDKIDDL